MDSKHWGPFRELKAGQHVDRRYQPWEGHREGTGVVKTRPTHLCMDRIKDAGNRCGEAFLRLVHEDEADLDDLVGGFARTSGRN